MSACPVGFRQSDFDLYQCDRPAGHSGYHAARMDWSDDQAECEPAAFVPAPACPSVYRDGSRCALPSGHPGGHTDAKSPYNPAAVYWTDASVSGGSEPNQPSAVAGNDPQPSAGG